MTRTHALLALCLALLSGCGPAAPETDLLAAQQSAGGDQGALEQLALNNPNDLVGVRVVDPEGQEVGQIRGALMKRGSTDLYLLMSAGGFGSGTDVAVQLQHFAIQDSDSLQLDSPQSVELFVASDFLTLENAG